MKRDLLLIPGLLLIVSFGFGCKTVSKLLAKNGTEFTVEVQPTGADAEGLVDRAMKITESKIDASGMTGEVIKDPANPVQFIVRLYGAADLERSKKFLFTSYELELKKVVSPPNPAPVNTYETAEEAAKAATNEQEVLPYEIHEGAMDRFVIVEKTPIITGDAIRDASAVSRASPNDYSISFSLKSDGAQKFGDWTGKNIGNYLAVVLNKKVQSVAYIKSQIFDSGEISGRFGKAEAEDIALGLKSGYLPAVLRVIDEKPIGK